MSSDELFYENIFLLDDNDSLNDYACLLCGWGVGRYRTDKMGI